MLPQKQHIFAFFTRADFKGIVNPKFLLTLTLFKTNMTFFHGRHQAPFTLFNAITKNSEISKLQKSQKHKKRIIREVYDLFCYISCLLNQIIDFL